jgi:hypothetical protein
MVMSKENYIRYGFLFAALLLVLAILGHGWWGAVSGPASAVPDAAGAPGGVRGAPIGK